MGHEHFIIEFWGDLSVDTICSALNADPTGRWTLPQDSEGAHLVLPGQLSHWQWILKVGPGHANHVFVQEPNFFDARPAGSMQTGDWSDWDHEVAAATIAQAFTALVRNPAVTGASYHCATTPLIIAWFDGDELNLPVYDRNEFAPHTWTETLDHYRPSLVAQLEALAIDFEAPSFGPRWAIEESHQFRDR